MQITKEFAYVGIFGSFLIAPAVNAADNCTGHVHNLTISSETVEVAKGHTLTTFVSHSFTSSENSPNNAVGECGGYAITTPDGKTIVAGSCARKTKDGDSWSDEWRMEPGAQRGTWKQTGGTGVFAGKNWTGWWQPVLSEGKIYMGIWGGTCN